MNDDLVDGTNITWNDMIRLLDKYGGKNAWSPVNHNDVPSPEECDNCHAALEATIEAKYKKKHKEQVEKLEAEYAKKIEDFKATFVPRRNISHLVS